MNGEADWFRIIVDLERGNARFPGLSHLEIGRQIGCGKTTVWNWKNGGEPRHSHGEKLIALHVKRCVPPEVAALLTPNVQNSESG